MKSDMPIWILLLVSALHPTVDGAEWTAPVEVRRGDVHAASYRAQLRGDWVLIEVRHQPDWHTYTMDNQLRAAEALKGQPALGSELPTIIDLGKGLEVDGKWYQSKPENLSKPELLWYSWGFSDVAVFAVKVKQTGPSQTVIRIEGQACDASRCFAVDVSLVLPLEQSRDRPTEPIDLAELVEVRGAKQD